MRFIHSIAEKEGHPRMAAISEFALRKILKKAKICPFKITYYCEKRDPDFDFKMHDVFVIYNQISLQFNEDSNLKPFEGSPVHTLSYDEKPSMQAIGNTVEDRPPVPDTEKPALSGGIMNMLTSGRFPYWRQSTCLPGERYRLSAQPIKVLILSVS